MTFLDRMPRWNAPANFSREKHEERLKHWIGCLMGDPVEAVKAAVAQFRFQKGDMLVVYGDDNDAIERVVEQLEAIDLGLDFEVHFLVVPPGAGVKKDRVSR